MRTKKIDLAGTGKFEQRTTRNARMSRRPAMVPPRRRRRGAPTNRGAAAGRGVGFRAEREGGVLEARPYEGNPSNPHGVSRLRPAPASSGANPAP